MGWGPPHDPGATAGAGPRSLYDDAGTIIKDLYCRRCGYNLRGLRDDGRCPECGSAVGLSTHGDLLHFADPDWVGNLARGGRLLMRGLTVAILAVIVSACGGGILGTLGGGGSGPSPAISIPIILLQLIVMGATIVVYYGVWLITSPDPSRVGEDASVTARKIVRIGVLGGLLSTVVEVIDTFGNSGPPAGVVLQAVNLLGSLLFMAGWLAYLRYAGKLAGRIPDDALVRRARQLFRLHIALFVLVALLIGLAFAAVVTAGSAGPPLSAGFGVVAASLGCGMVVGWLIVFLMYVRFQHRLGQAFEGQAAFARETWAADRGPEQDAEP